MKPALRRTVLFSLLSLLAACGGDPATPTPLPTLPALATQAVADPEATASRSWDGVIEAVQQADLSAQTAGRVVEVSADLNDRVAAGSVLLRLTAVEQQANSAAARARLRATEAAATEAQATYARYVELADRQLVSKLQLDQLKASRDAAVASRDAARAQLQQTAQQADYTIVRAPFDGIISGRRVEPGESINPGQALLSIYAPESLRIEVQVPQTAAAAIRALNQAEVLLADGRRIEAASVQVFPAADELTHSVGVRLTLPSLADPPTPGTTAKVLFAIENGERLLHIPSSALVQRGELNGVYVLDGQRLSLRQLRIGRRDAAQVEILAGLAAGEVIATDPVAALQALVTQRSTAGTGHE